MVDDNKLSKLSAMWKKVVPIVPSFSNVPDGDYVADIKELKLADSKAGRLQVITTVEIIDGELAGKTVKRFDGVEEETGMGYFKNLCEVIGLDLPDDLRLWQEAMDVFVGDENRIDLYDVTVKTNPGKEGGSYSNLYINGVSDLVKGGEEQVEEEVQEEVVEEVVEEEVQEEVAEEEVQEIVVPPKKVAAKPVAQKAVMQKAVAQPIRKVSAPAPAPAPVVTPQRKIVALKRK